jgi:hypothetical protein
MGVIDRINRIFKIYRFDFDLFGGLLRVFLPSC